MLRTSNLWKFVREWRIGNPVSISNRAEDHFQFFGSAIHEIFEAKGFRLNGFI